MTTRCGRRLRTAAHHVLFDRNLLCSRRGGGVIVLRRLHPRDLRHKVPASRFDSSERVEGSTLGPQTRDQQTWQRAKTHGCSGVATGAGVWSKHACSVDGYEASNLGERSRRMSYVAATVSRAANELRSRDCVENSQ